MARDQIELISRAVIRWGAHVLACRHEKKGYLYLPGGHVEFGESAEDAVLRELQEEAGLEGQVLGCALVCECRFEQGGHAHHELNIVFHVEHSRLPPHPSPSTAPPAVASREPKIGFEWVDLASVVDRDFRPRAIKAWLASGAPVGYPVGDAAGRTGALWLSDAE